MNRLATLLVCAALLMPTLARAEDEAKPPPPELQALKDALGGDDSDAKRTAIHALAAAGLGADDDVLPLLVQAVGDRQASDAAIQALRSRTGLAPSPYVGQSHYPGYPSSDKPSDWTAWLGERKRDLDEKKKVKEALETAKEAKKDAQKAEKEAKSGSATAGAVASGDGGSATAAAVRQRAVAEDLGQLYRIVFRNGGNLICYVLTRHSDADGNLVSLRVVHTDGSGEETLDASLISRIEEASK